MDKIIFDGDEGHYEVEFTEEWVLCNPKRAAEVMKYLERQLRKTQKRYRETLDLMRLF